MAKKTISQLNIKVTASSDGVKRGLGKAKGELRGFKSGAAAAMRGVAAGAAVAAAAVAGIGLAAKKALSKLLAASAEFDETIKRARALNVEASKLEAVQLLAELSGAAAGTAGVALERLAMSIGDATRGTGEAADAFATLGLNVDALKDQSVIDSMEDIGRALSGVGTRAEQLDILGAIIGSRQAGSLINTFEAMKGGLGAISELMDAIGLNLDDIQKDNLEEMNDAIVAAKEASKAFWRHLAAELAPSITVLATASAEFMSELIPFVPVIARTIESVAKLATAMNPLVWLMTRVIKAARAMGLMVDNEVAAKFRAAREPVVAMTETMEETRAAVDEIHTSMVDAFDPSRIADLKAELSGIADAEGPAFRVGSTFGGDIRSQGGMSAVNAAVQRRHEQMREDRKLADEQAKRDIERDRILREISAELRKPRKPVSVSEATIVG